LFPFSEDFGQLRLDTPYPLAKDDPSAGDKCIKYLSPLGKASMPWLANLPAFCSASAPLGGVGLGDSPDSMPSIYTEGFKDAAIASVNGVRVGAIAGVSHWLKLFEQGCGASFVFDSDGWSNPEVMAHLIHAGMWTGGKILILPPMPNHPKGGLCEWYKLGNVLDMDHALSPSEMLAKWKDSWKKFVPKHKHSDAAKKIRLLTKELADPEEWLAQKAKQKKEPNQKKIKGKGMTDSKRESRQDDTLAERDVIYAYFEDRLRYNALLHQYELDGEVFEPSQTATHLLEEDILITELSDLRQKQLAERIGHQKPYNPILEEIKRCYKGEPFTSIDEARRFIDNLAFFLFGLDNPLDSEKMRVTILSAVARANQPGCKVDTVTVLSGKQGLGKSTFWKILCGDKYFCDDFSFAAGKDDLMKMHRAWITEWGEMASFGKRETEHIKRSITVSTDLIRYPYEARVSAHPRPGILVGTTNEPEFLRDSTGNRRWLILEAEKIDLDWLKSNRDRVLSAAQTCYLAGDQWHVKKELEEPLAECSLTFLDIDDWQDLIEQYVCPDPEDPGAKNVVAIQEIYDCVIELEVCRRNTSGRRRIADILRKLGFVKLSERNKLTYHSYTPKNPMFDPATKRRMRVMIREVPAP
jgi:predicted P-loop ATPase